MLHGWRYSFETCCFILALQPTSFNFSCVITPWSMQALQATAIFHAISLRIISTVHSGIDFALLFVSASSQIVLVAIEMFLIIEQELYPANIAGLMAITCHLHLKIV